jgi:hypothetical protein
LTTDSLRLMRRLGAVLLLTVGFLAVGVVGGAEPASACGAPPAGIRTVRFVGRAARVSTGPGDPVWTFVVDPPQPGLESTVSVQISSVEGGSDCAVTTAPPVVGSTYSIEALRLGDTFAITNVAGGYTLATDDERGTPTVVRSKKPIVPIVLAVFVSLAAAVVAVASIVDKKRVARSSKHKG